MPGSIESTGRPYPRRFSEVWQQLKFRAEEEVAQVAFHKAASLSPRAFAQ